MRVLNSREGKSLEELTQDLAEYERLPSYNMMVLKFWIWNVEDFKK